MRCLDAALARRHQRAESDPANRLVQYRQTILDERPSVYTSLLAELDLFAFVATVPTTKLVTHVRDALATEGIALFVEHEAVQQLGEPLRRRQHRVPRVQRAKPGRQAP